MARARKPVVRPDHGGDDTALLLARLRGVGLTQPEDVIAEKKRRIDGFKPAAGDVDAQLQVVAFIRPFLLACDLTPTGVSNMLRMVPRTGTRQLRVGNALTMRSLIGVDAVNQFFAREGSHYSELTRSRIRSAASQLGRAVGMVPDYPPLQAVFPRSKRGAPYTRDFIEAYLDEVRHAPEPLRGDATTLVHLATAGIATPAIKQVRGDHVTRLDHQTLIWLPDANGFGLRRLLGPAGDFIANRALQVGDRHLLRPEKARGPSVEEVVSALHLHLDLPRFQVQRAVDRWLVELLNESAYGEFMQLSGQFASTHTIDDLRKHMAPSTTERCIDLLVATTDRMHDTP